jgi:hypothetical protein
LTAPGGTWNGIAKTIVNRPIPLAYVPLNVGTPTKALSRRESAERLFRRAIRRQVGTSREQL